MSAAVEPMRFHGPGWSLSFSQRDEYGEIVERGACYQLWAPQDGQIADPYADTWSTDKEPRDHWAAAWQSADGDDGDFVRGTTLAEALRIFPPAIRRQFEGAVPH